MPFNDKDRLFALRRALKMNALFREGTFDAIMNAVYMPSDTDAEKAAREAAFVNACTASGLLDDVEIEWLWNYLQHVYETGFKKRDGTSVDWRDLREAAAQTGW